MPNTIASNHSTSQSPSSTPGDTVPPGTEFRPTTLARMTKVVLIRHARSTANAEGVLAGRMPGVKLDEVGRRQARDIGELLAAAAIAAHVRQSAPAVQTFLLTSLTTSEAEST